MSGGALNYVSYRIGDLADELRELATQLLATNRTSLIAVSIAQQTDALASELDAAAVVLLLVEKAQSGDVDWDRIKPDLERLLTKWKAYARDPTTE